jgi:hypothetical protein
VFNHDFYNNEDIMNGDISFEDAIFGAERLDDVLEPWIFDQYDAPAASSGVRSS